MTDENFSESAKAHWKYIESVITTHDPEIDPEVLEMIGFHYVTVMIHGYKHGRQYEQELMEKMGD